MEDLANRYRKLLTESDTIEIFDITSPIAIAAAKLRAQYNLKTPDSIQLATAMESNADFFLTNDIRLKQVSHINMLVLDEIS